MQQGFRFRAYPNAQQAETLLRWIGCQRFIYNAKVEEDRYYRACQRRLVNVGIQRPIDQQYARFITDETPWLREVPSVVLRNGAVRWKNAYSRHFSGLGGRPKIRKRHGRQSVWLTCELFKFERRDEQSWRLIIGTPKHALGELRFVAHVPLEQAPASIRVSVEAGRWYLSFSLDDEQPEYTEAEIGAWLRAMSDEEILARTIGCDRGVANPLMTDKGLTCDFTSQEKRRFKRRSKRCKKLQRQAARQLAASKRSGVRSRCYAKTKLAIARSKAKDARVRNDFAHRTSYRLAELEGVALYGLEDLKIANMTRSASGSIEQPGRNVAQKKGLNRSILGSAWGAIRIYLTYKARCRHKLVVAVLSAFTSQDCSQCGHRHKDNRRSQAVFVCQACGFEAHADVNAAGNIRMRAVEQLTSEAWTPKKSKRTMRMRRKGDTQKDRQDLSDRLPSGKPLLVEEVLDCAGQRPAQQSLTKRERTLTPALVAE